MKKIRLFFVLGAMVLGIAACGSSSESTNGNATSEKAEDSNVQKEDEVEESAKDKKSEGTDYQITINGVDYDFPMTYQEFIDMGWTNSEDPTGNLEKEKGLSPDYSDGDMRYDNGDIHGLEVLIYNPYDEFTTYENCMVVGLIAEMDSDEMQIPAGSIVVNGYAKIGESSKEDVFNCLGKDWSQETFDKHYSDLEILVYYMDDDYSDTMTISFEDGVFSEITYEETD